MTNEYLLLNYLDAGTLCRGIPETVALPVGLDTDVFPPGTTISSA